LMPSWIAFSVLHYENLLTTAASGFELPPKERRGEEPRPGGVSHSPPSTVWPSPAFTDAGHSRRDAGLLSELNPVPSPCTCATTPAGRSPACCRSSPTPGGGRSGGAGCAPDKRFHVGLSKVGEGVRCGAVVKAHAAVDAHAAASGQRRAASLAGLCATFCAIFCAMLCAHSTPHTPHATWRTWRAHLRHVHICAI